MPRGRPRQFTDERLLDAAREVFLEQGFAATTEEVAHRAGVSEGILFHRFESKERLFREAMRFDDAADPAPLKEIQHLADTIDLPTAIHDTILGMIDFGRIALPLMMMSWSNPNKSGIEEELRRKKDPPLRHRRTLTAFFQGEKDRGHLRPCAEPEVLAFVLLGAVHSYVFSSVMHRSAESSPMPAESFARSLTEVILNGGGASQLAARASSVRPRKRGASR